LLALLRNHRTYFTLASLFIVVGLVLLLILPKGGLVQSFDAHSNGLLDSFFMVVTKIGELVGATIVFIILVFWADKKYRVIFPISVVFTLLISQGLKHYVYGDEHRPFHTYPSLHYIDGLERHTNNSFPSGHTTAAFT
jgi:membrane-associated phospholipid phosphatase